MNPNVIKFTKKLRQLSIFILEGFYSHPHPNLKAVREDGRCVLVFSWHIVSCHNIYLHELPLDLLVRVSKGTKTQNPIKNHFENLRFV